MDVTLDQLRELAKNASPGPWSAKGFMVEQADAGRGYSHSFRFVAHTGASGHDAAMCEADAAYIAAVDPKTVIGLLDLIEAWRAENTRHMREAEDMANKVQGFRQKLDFLKSNGITVGILKDQNGERLSYMIEPGSELCDLETLRKLTDAEIERDRLRRVLVNIVECRDMAAELYTSDIDMANSFADKARAALSEQRLSTVEQNAE